MSKNNNQILQQRKGIILAGGSGTRLSPVTRGVCKQLLPIYDKPMIYYPLSVIMLSGVRQIAIITTPEDRESFTRLLGDGSQWGLSFEYLVQDRPEGLAHAYILAEEFLDGSPSIMALGDNIFFGPGLTTLLLEYNNVQSGAVIFGYQVNDPKRFGVIEFDQSGHVKSIEEKPQHPKSNYAITGLYMMDASAPSRAKKVKPSQRGELEITCLLNTYLEEQNLFLQKFNRGFAWLDTGTHESMLDASNFVRTIQTQQGFIVGSPEEVAFRHGWISEKDLHASIENQIKSEYGKNLLKIVPGS
ncbi:MAG: glucose-1-phosphate thymidylyltransferase RfbA [Bdellovibrionales bacterium]|nr:glucose-1-phosphate thymidylyltransferase RfbA [Bdellovibrionales bacterium]